MYWVVRNAWISWREKDLYAAIIDIPWEPLQEPLWWGNIPIPEPRPNFKFRIDSQAPLPDNYVTGNEFSLYSERLIGLLRAAGVKHETFTTQLFDEVTNTPLAPSHKVFRLLEMAAGVDEEKSVYENKKIIGKLTPLIKQIALKESFLESRIPMARLASELHIVLIYEELKRILEQNEITGFYYRPL
jgi:hypothetical protein